MSDDPTTATKQLKPRAKKKKRHPWVLIVMGVAGSGKTDVTEILAQETTNAMVDADKHHDSSAEQKMSRGEPLDDAYRDGWVERVCGAATNAITQDDPENVIVACSCLKRRHRDRFCEFVRKARIEGAMIRIVYLEVPEEELQRRLVDRDEQGTHFMPATQLANQLKAFEPPNLAEELEVRTIDGTGTQYEVSKRVWDAVPEFHPFAQQA